jgi:hypothetical protein
MGTFGYFAWPAPKPRLNPTILSACTITPASQPLNANPAPEYATDQQLTSEALVLDENLLNLLQIKSMSSENNPKQTKEQSDAKDCEILQEYEFSYRALAVALKQAIGVPDLLCRWMS